MSEALDSQLKFTESGGNWWIASGECDEYYYDGDAAQSDYDLPDTGGEACLQAIVDSDSSQTVQFYWKVSSEQNHDYLQFYIDSTLKDQISGEVGWQPSTNLLALIGEARYAGPILSAAIGAPCRTQ